MLSTYAAVFLIFMVFSLVIGFLFSKRSKNLEDYFLASRSLSAPLVFLTVCASWIGASSMLVSTDEALLRGISSFWVMGMPTVVTVLIFAILLARPIRRLSILSLPDLVEKRYGRVVRHMSSVLIVWYMVLLGASQMVALGQFLRLFLGTSYLTSLLIGTAVVLAYSLLGGFLSVVATDGIQFLFLAVGLGTLVLVMIVGHGLHGIADAAASMGKNHYFDFFFDAKRNILIFFSFTLAWTVSPITWQRIQGAKNQRSAVRGLWFAAAFLLAAYAGLVLIGMMSLPAGPADLSGRPLLARIIVSLGASPLGLLLFIAIVAAVMSTLDTAINTGALSLAHDLIGQTPFICKKQESPFLGRISTLLIAISSLCVATQFQSILRTLGLASEIMTEGLFIPGIAMIFLRKRYPAAGAFSLVSGGLFALMGFGREMGLWTLPWPPWPISILYGLSLSGLAFAAGAVFDRKNRIS